MRQQSSSNMGVMKDATAQMVKIEQDGPAALHQVPCWSAILPLAQ